MPPLTEDKAEQLLDLLQAAQAPTVTSGVTVTSGTPQENSGKVPLTYHLPIKGAGKAVITVAPTKAEAETPGAGAISQTVEVVASQIDVQRVKVPAGWWLNVTLTTATLGTVVTST